MTLLEVRALLARVDARQLREDAGISTSTVARAFGVDPCQVSAWERSPRDPRSHAAFRWAAFTLGLERRAEVMAEVTAEMDEAA